MQEKYITYWEVIVFFASMLLFGVILFFRADTLIASDIKAHVQLIQSVARGASLPPANFMFYLLVYTIAIFNIETLPLYIATVLILSLSVAAKFTISRVFLIQHYRSALKNNVAPEAIIPFISILLLIVFSLPTNNFYIGQIPPNVWHNSTVIFVMPFALLLFWLTYNQLVHPTVNRTVPITILCILNILIKPSFFFVLFFAYPLMLLRCFGLRQYPWKNLIPIVIGSFIAAVMYYLIYKLSFGNIIAGGSGIAFRPFWIWAHLSKNITLSLIFSLVFPITYLGFYREDFMKHMILQYAVIAYLIAITIAILLSETGPREFHANFFWQAIMCSYILFLVTAALYVEKFITTGMRDWKNMIILISFISHVVAGILYLVKFFYTNSYY